MFTSVRG